MPKPARAVPEDQPERPEETPGRPSGAEPDATTLGRVLYAMRYAGVRVAVLEGRAPWAVRTEDESSSLLYVVRRGSAFLRFAGEPTPVLLEEGDVAVLPIGKRHVLGEGGGAPDDLSTLLDRRRNGGDEPEAHRQQANPRLEVGGEGFFTDQPSDSEILVALLELEGTRERALFALLPGLVVMDADARGRRRAVDAALAMVDGELDAAGPLTTLVLARLFDVLVMKALEGYLERQRSTPGTVGTRWLAGLDDRQVARALVAMHQRPEAPWTVATLAAEVGMSRSTFADRFQTLVGEPPLSYLTRFRIERAGMAIRRGAGIAEAAMAVGYRSEAAFARAFRREHGQSPSAWRRDE